MPAFMAADGGRRAITRGRPWLLCRSKAEAKYLDKAAGHRQVADKYEAAGGCEADRTSARTKTG